MDLNKVEEQLKKVPENIKKLFFSIDTARKIEEIGQKNDLHIDQIDTLIEETGYSIIGLKPPTQFVDIISRALKIDGVVAKKIANEINMNILSDIKTEIRRNETYDTETPSRYIEDTNKVRIESAGGFTIEKDPGQDDNLNSPGAGDGSGTDSEVTPGDRAKILNDIEFPTGVKERLENMSQSSGRPQKEYPHTEPLVDQLLSGSTANIEKKVIVNIPGIISPSNVPSAKPVETSVKPTDMPQKPTDTSSKPKGPDMYREPIK